MRARAAPKARASPKALAAWWKQIDEWRGKKSLKYKQGKEVIMPQYVVEKLYEVTGGEAFITLGKIRPDVPTKVSAPSPSAHARTASGGIAARLGPSAADPVKLKA